MKAFFRGSGIVCAGFSLAVGMQWAIEGMGLWFFVLLFGAGLGYAMFPFDRKPK